MESSARYARALCGAFFALCAACGAACGEGAAPADASSEDGGWDAADGAPDAEMADAEMADAAIADAQADLRELRDATIVDAAEDTAAEDGTAEDAEPALRDEAPYPLVLAHGFFGYDDFAGAGFNQYFYGVQSSLEEAGFEVFLPTVDPFNNSRARGEELAARIAEIRALTGVAKVNLIGHSQGGLDARYVAATRPEWVASVTTIATPHHGSPAADVILRIVIDDRFGELVDALLRLIAAPLWDAAGEETSVITALRQLSSEGMEAFNEEFPDSEGIPYFSIAGRTNNHYGPIVCRAEGSPEFITRWSAYLDGVDPLLSLSEAVVYGGNIFDPHVNDGLVRVEDARWGRFLGCIPADHLDQIGQLFGDRASLANPFDHRAFYRGLATWLRDQGF